MKTFFRVLAVSVAAAAFNFLIGGILMFAGIGPHGRALRLVTSGAMNSYNEATSRAWFQAAEQSVMFDRFVLWPTTFLLASILIVRFVPKGRWWHSIVIACAVLPLSLPSAIEMGGLRLPGSSALSSWVSSLTDLLTELLAYALLVAVFLYLVRKLQSLRSGRRSAA
jgi:hypothetical protein